MRLCTVNISKLLMLDNANVGFQLNKNFKCLVEWCRLHQPKLSVSGKNMSKYFKPIQCVDLLEFISLLRRLQFYCSLLPNVLIQFCVKYFVVVGAFAVNKCIFFNSFQISVYLNHFAYKSNIQETCCSKIFIVAC